MKIKYFLPSSCCTRQCYKHNKSVKSSVFKPLNLLGMVVEKCNKSLPPIYIKQLYCLFSYKITKLDFKKNNGLCNHGTNWESMNLVCKATLYLN